MIPQYFIYLNVPSVVSCSSPLCFRAKVVRRATKRQLSVITEDAQAEWAGLDPQDESELPTFDTEVSVGGIYLRLLVANPGWVLRKPKETMSELLEAALQGLQKDSVNFVTFLPLSLVRKITLGKNMK